MDGWVKIGTELDTKRFDGQINYIENQLDEIKEKLNKADMGFEVGDTAKLESQYEKLSSQLITLKTKQMEVNKTDLSNVSKTMDTVGKSTESTIRKIGKLVLAVFSIRSAYLGVRRAVSTLSQYNDQIKTDLAYMEYSLAEAMAPVVEWLIRMAYQLLNLVNQISMSLFHYNLFANSSASAFEKANKSAKDLKKTTAGFDEMNILNSNTNTNASPGVDLSKLQGETPSWLKWIKDNGGFVAGIISLIGTAIIGANIAEFLGKLGLLGKEISGIGTIVKGLGIGLILEGIIILIRGIIDFIKDPSWNNFLTILEGIALIVAGIAVLMGGWIVALVALGAAIVAYVIQNWDKVKGILGAIGGWIYDHIIKPIGDYFKFMGEQIFDFIKQPIDAIKNYISSMIDSVKTVWKGIQQILNGDVSGGLKTIFKGIINGILTLVNFLIDGINMVISPIRLLVVAIGKVMGKNWTMDNIKIPTIKYLATGGIVNYPNKGVPISNNVRAGESGAEGVIPLTDTQAMETLGNAIGRYITINNTIYTKFNGRTINKEIQRTQNGVLFSMNA